MYNVLIADDNRQIVSILSEYCKKNNFNVFFAHDGEETLNKIKNENKPQKACFCLHSDWLWYVLYRHIVNAKTVKTAFR